MNNPEDYAKFGIVNIDHYDALRKEVAEKDAEILRLRETIGAQNVQRMEGYGKYEDSIRESINAQYRAEIMALKLDKENLRAVLMVIPAFRLRALAEYIDFYDKKSGITGDEVQRDLRRMADLSEEALAQSGQKGGL